MRAVGLFQLWGDSSRGEVVVVGADGASYSLDVSRLSMLADETGNVSPPVSQESLSPDGRYAFFPQERSLEVYDFDRATLDDDPASGAGPSERASGPPTAAAIEVRRRRRLRRRAPTSTHPTGQHVGTTRSRRTSTSGPRGGDDFYGRSGAPGTGAVPAG